MNNISTRYFAIIAERISLAVKAIEETWLVVVLYSLVIFSTACSSASHPGLPEPGDEDLDADGDSDREILTEVDFEADADPEFDRDELTEGDIEESVDTEAEIDRSDGDPTDTDIPEEDTEPESDAPSPVHPSFVEIDTASFWMGSPDGDCHAEYPSSCGIEAGREADEKLHEIGLTVDFLMQEHEVSQGLWRKIARFEGWGESPHWFTDCEEDCPVERVSWMEAVAFANALSRHEGLSECYNLKACSGTPGMGCDSIESCSSGFSCMVELNGVTRPQDCEGYRLPTEAEWEYAARAGGYDAFHADHPGGGGSRDAECIADPALDPIGWYCDNAEDMTHPVKNRQANSWGLYDMSGNVREWVWDSYCSDYEEYPPIDPHAASCPGEERINRGGGWNDFAQDCRSADRRYDSPQLKDSKLGFRLVRSLMPRSCDPDPCSGLGSCNMSSGRAYCNCDPEYAGSHCSRCAFGSSIAYPTCFLPPEGYCETSQCWTVPDSGLRSCFNDTTVIACVDIGGSDPPVCEWPPELCGVVPEEDGDGEEDAESTEAMLDEPPSDFCFCGQDGQYEDRRRRLFCIDSSGERIPCVDVPVADDDEVVLDSLTGLMWQRKLQKFYEGCQSEQFCTPAEAAAYCAGLDSAGYKDWRLPSVFEYLSLIDCSAYDPSIDDTVFPFSHTLRPYFWSATVPVQVSGLTWYVNFFNGHVFMGLNGGGSVRCVRDIPDSDKRTQRSEEKSRMIGEKTSASQDSDRYLVSGDDEAVVLDLITGLRWQSDFTTSDSWSEALTTCENLEYGGHSDWRLPSKNELASLIDYSRYDPASDFPGMPSGGFLSSTTLADDNREKWKVHFGLGIVTDQYVEFRSPYFVRCLRGGPG